MLRCVQTKCKAEFLCYVIISLVTQTEAAMLLLAESLTDWILLMQLPITHGLVNAYLTVCVYG